MDLEVAGIKVNPAVIAPLDSGFLPAALFNREYRKLAANIGPEAFYLALERGDGSVSRFDINVIPLEAGHIHATFLFLERIVKFLLWQIGGWKITVSGPRETGDYIAQVYSRNGARAFDVKLMEQVYEKSFVVERLDRAKTPDARES